jgi:hypothetical protein
MGFFATLFSVLTLGHLYVWKRLVMDGELRRGWKLGVSLVLVCGLAGFGLLWFVRRELTDSWSVIVGTASFLWLGVVWYLVLLLAVVDVVAWSRRGMRWLRGREAPAPDPERRRFLARAVGGTAVFGTFGIGAAGVKSALGDVTTPEVAVALRGLPPALSGFRIALLSDVHVSGLVDREFLAGIVAQTNELRPDMVAITGDLVDAPVARLRMDVAPLEGLVSRCGTYFVTGNHEFYSGVDEWVRHLPTMGIRVLQNECVRIGDRSPLGASFDLAGIHDPTGRGRGDPWAPDIGRAVDGRDPERGLVLLAHQPRQIRDGRRAGAGLQLSGHTHGGQVWPFGLVTALVQPYIHGLHLDGDTWIYVTRGTGFWGPPMRVFAPAEITTIVLTPA